MNEKNITILIKRINNLLILLLGVIILAFSCSCSRKTETVEPNSFWYGCCSFHILPTEGYNQEVYSANYSDGYYYLTVYGQKISEETEGVSDYYRLYKVDPEGNCINTVSLPTECLSGRDQAIVGDRLYCVEPNSNTEYVIDINTGDVVDENMTTESIQGYYAIADGYVKITNDSAIRFSNDGEETGRINISELSNLNNKSPFYEKDGKYYLVEDSIYQMDFFELDFDNGLINKVFDTTEISNNLFDVNRDVVFTDRGVYYVDFDSASLIPITEWSYVDVKPAYKTTLYEVNLSYGCGRFGKLYRYNDSEIELIIFNNISSDVYSDRIPITIGGYDVQSSLAIKWAVYEFNTSQDEYRAYLDEYRDKYPYTSGVEAQAQITQLIQYFNEGNAPDIYFGTNFDYRYMYNAGLVADILPTMQNDPEFDTGDLEPSIYNTIAGNGVCYQVFSAFTFNGDFGLRSIFGDDEVTYTMISELAQESGISVRGDMQSAEFADQILRYSLGDLVDRSSGEHVVTVDELRGVVEYSVNNGIPYYAAENNIADMDTVHDGLYLTCRRFLRNIYDLSDIESSLNDSFVYLGFPSIYGSAHAAEPDGLVAISADTQYSDACWQLIKIMLSNEVQEIEIGQGYSPVMSGVLDEYCRYVSDPGSVPDDEIIWNSIVSGRDAVPDWIISDYQSMVNSIDSVISYDWGIYNIVCEEINSYDLQGKSIDAIAESLQSRLDLYVLENYG